MNADQLHRLLKLSNARKTQALALLERVVAEDTRLADEIDRVRALPLNDLDMTTVGVPPAQIALRLNWADQSVRQMIAKRASLAPEIKRLRREAALLLGKHEALGELTARADTERAQTRIKRAEAEVPFIPTGDQ